MRNTKLYCASGTLTLDGVEHPLHVFYRIYPGRPGVRTLPNGDPGYPDEPPELEVIEVEHQGEVAIPLTQDELLEVYLEQMDDNEETRLYEEAGEQDQEDEDHHVWEPHEDPNNEQFTHHNPSHPDD